MLIRAAVLVHGEDARGDVPDAIERLLLALAPRVRAAQGSPAAGDPLVPANDFRKRCCYTEASSAVLTRHLASLTLLYECYSVGDGAVGAELARREARAIQEPRMRYVVYGRSDAERAGCG